MPDTKADLTHALRFAIQLAEAEGYPECAAGLRVALDRLTHPTDLSEQDARIRAEKEIAALTEKQDRAMKVVATLSRLLAGYRSDVDVILAELGADKLMQ